MSLVYHFNNPFNPLIPYLHEHVESTRAARMAATAPSQALWGAIIRQQSSLARQLERKIRLLMELQRERKSEERESLKASSPPDAGDPQEGGPGRRQPAAQKTDNRGNELKDLLQTQGITEMAASKRTHFRA